MVRPADTTTSSQGSTSVAYVQYNLQDPGLQYPPKSLQWLTVPKRIHYKIVSLIDTVADPEGKSGHGLIKFDYRLWPPSNEQIHWEKHTMSPP